LTRSTGPAAPAPAAVSPREAAAVAAARGLAADLRERLGLPGLACGVAVRGRTVLAEGLGWADVERRVGVTETSRFRIGSLSKLLTATAAVRLAAAGRLDLDAPIGRYLRGLPADKAPLTVRQLGGHLAGVRHYRGDDFLSRVHFDRVGDSLVRFVNDPLLARPGARYLYSSYGFNLIGAALEGATGHEFRDVIAEEVLAPLAMADTVAEDAARPSERLVHAYSRGADGANVDAPMADLSDRWPSGGYDSTVVDMLRLGAGVLRPGFLSRGSRAMLFTPQHTADGKPTIVGLGWEVGADASGRLYVHHGGATFGGRAVLVVYPQEDVVVALLANLTLAPFDERDALAMARPFLLPVLPE
jgi:CubicO group peptidase (beta-lactamase class C family)